MVVNGQVYANVDESELKTYQTEMVLKRATNLDFITVSAIIFTVLAVVVYF